MLLYSLLTRFLKILYLFLVGVGAPHKVLKALCEVLKALCEVLRALRGVSKALYKVLIESTM